jgi:uncharacterized protein YjiS (DUF1127 family)
MDRTRTYDNPGIEEISAFPSYAEINHHVRTAQQLRAEATTYMLLEAGRGLADILRPIRAQLARWQERHETQEALMRCSDRLLADIGIEREDIPLVAKGLDPAQHETRIEALRRRWATARDRLKAAREARRERLRVFRELMSYQDHELDDLGVRRPDIARIARTEPSLQPAE